MNLLNALMVWFGLGLGATEEQALAYWNVPNPTPKVWQRARLKTADGKPYGVYLHGDFKNQSAPNTPVSVEHIFVGNRLSVTTWYFSGITPLTSKEIYHGWQAEHFKQRPPKPSAEVVHHNRNLAYFVEGEHTRKWVFTRDSLTIRVSHNSRSPTTLAEAIAGGAKTKAKLPVSTKAYADLHRQALAKESVVARGVSLKKKDLPPPLRADTELVLGMGLAARASAALDESPTKVLAYGLCRGGSTRASHEDPHRKAAKTLSKKVRHSCLQTRAFIL